MLSQDQKTFTTFGKTFDVLLISSNVSKVNNFIERIATVECGVIDELPTGEAIVCTFKESILTGGSK